MRKREREGEREFVSELKTHQSSAWRAKNEKTTKRVQKKLAKEFLNDFNMPKLMAIIKKREKK